MLSHGFQKSINEILSYLSNNVCIQAHEKLYTLRTNMIQRRRKTRQKLGDFFVDCGKGFKLLWKIKPGLFALNSLLFLLQAIVPLCSLLYLKKLVDDIVDNGVDIAAALPTLAIFAVLQVITIILVQLSSYYTSIQQQIISDKIAADVLDKAVKLGIEYYENPTFYDDLHMVQQQSLYRPAQLIAASNSIIQNFTTVVLFSGFMFMVHWSVFILVLILGIPLTISKLVNSYKQYQLERANLPEMRKSNDLYQYLTTDAFAKEVRIFNFGGLFIEQFRDLKQSIFNRKKDLQRRHLWQSTFIQAFEVVATVAIYCIIILRAGTGVISIGGLVIYLQAFQRLQGGFTSLFQSAISLFQHQLYLREILRYLDTPSEQSVIMTDASIPDLSKGIFINNLCFRYPDTESDVLHNISMSFKPGTVTAIAGANGSGKSTLIKLLCGLYNVAPGCITWGGIDITGIDQEIITQETSAVFQDFGKYYLTVEENITFGRAPNLKKLAESMQIAGIARKVDGFSNKDQTILGRTYKHGEQLSGGQWQKIAVTRALYKDARIIILDEPTSAIDPLSEQHIFESLKKDIGDRIIILITHRLYNLKLADYIYVMDSGKVAESGSFDTLLAGDTLFSHIYEKQLV